MEITKKKNILIIINRNEINLNKYSYKIEFIFQLINQNS